MKTVEATSLTFCTIPKLETLHLEQTIAQLKCANNSTAHCACAYLCSAKWRNGNGFCLFQKVGILDVDILDCLLPETNRLFSDSFD